MRRYRRSYRRRIVLLGLLVVAVALRMWWGAASGAARQRNAAVVALPPGSYQVARVVDGDTLVLAAGRGRVRLQGIDAPELATEHRPAQPYADAATAFAAAFVRDAARRVRVEIDGEAVDHYGRHLAFVWANDRMLNEELVRSGLARAKLDYDYSQAKKNLLRRAQQDAQRSAVGLWSP